jgi:2-alkenal reductase
MQKLLLPLASLLSVLALAGCDPNLQSKGRGVDPHVIQARGTLAESEQATIAIFRSASPSVVLVISGQRDVTGMQTVAVAGGTGFIWDQQGHVVTNNHVVASASEIVVRMPGGEDIPATVIGRAANYDLAVLQLSRVPANAPPLAIGTSNDLQVGQATFAIGNPFGFDQTITSGIVSALGRRLPTEDGREIADVIQTDAAINPGNSGGPLLDSAGRVIGVTTAIFSPSGAYAGVGFAVPVDTVARVVPQLIQDGRAPVAGIGILAADEAIASRVGVEGVLVWQTVPGSPAARVGLHSTNPSAGELGDVIVEAEGAPIRRLADLTNTLDRLGVGHSVSLTLLRNGERVAVSVPIEDIGGRETAGGK